MRAPAITQGQETKAASGWFGGCNTERNPWILDDAMYAYGVNVVNKGGVAQTRPGYLMQLTLPPGNLQGFAIMTVNKQDQYGNIFQGGAQFCIFAVNGLVYATPFPLTQPKAITDWTEWQLPNIQFQADAIRIYFCVAQKSLSTVQANIQLNSTYNVLMMQDGISAAAYWDGDQNLHVNEDSPDYSTPTGTWMSFSGNRLWLARGKAAIPSDLLDPLSFLERISGATQGDFLLPEDITGMVNTVGYTFETNLMVFTLNQTFSFLTYIENRETWSTTPNFETILYPSIGCVAGWSIVNHAGLLWWYSKNGLLSFNSATTAYLTSRVKYMDNEMVAWTSEMFEDKSGIASISFGSYLLISIPANDVFNAKTMVMDYSVADELNSVAPPAWQGVWTGIRPVNWISTLIENTGETQCLCASVDYEPLNGSHNHIWLAFQDNRTDAYTYTNASNALVTSNNPIYCAFESKLLGDGLDLKVFRWALIDLMEISGQLNFKVSYRGTRGSYKQIMKKQMIAITDAWQTNNPEILELLANGTVLVPQTRRLLTIVAQPLNSKRENAVESEWDETIDRCYSIYCQWCGRAAVESIMLVVEPQPEKVTGANEEDETYLNTVTQDGTSQAYDPSPLQTTGTAEDNLPEFNFSNNLYNRPFTPRFRDVYYSSIPPLTTIGTSQGCITCLPCARDNYPPVTFDPTTNDEGPGYGPLLYVGNEAQAYTATCPQCTTGIPVTVNIPADSYFSLNQQASNQIAYNAAIVKAQSELECVSLAPSVTPGTLEVPQGEDFTYQIIATGSPTSYGATNLPEGVSINTTTGIISGSVAIPNTYTIGISATNSCGTGNGTLLLEIEGVGPLNPFDFAIIRYTWTESDGIDLDTRTAYINSGTGYDNLYVGWDCQDNPPIYGYLGQPVQGPSGGLGQGELTISDPSGNLLEQWGGDNTTPSGDEAVLLGLNQFSEDYPLLATITVQLRAYWYNTRIDGNLTIQFETYLGGSMVQYVTPQGQYDWNNVGGVLVDNISVARNSITVAQTGSGPNRSPLGDDMGTLVYTPSTKMALIYPPA